MERNMNTATFEALRKVGATEAQAKVIATAIPDVNQPITEMRSEMDLRFTEMRSEMHLGFEQVNTRFEQVNTRFEQVNTQIARQRNVSIISTLVLIVTVLGSVYNIWGVLQQLQEAVAKIPG